MEYNNVETFCFEDLDREDWIRFSLTIRSIEKAKTIGKDLGRFSSYTVLHPLRNRYLSPIYSDRKPRGLKNIS